MTTGTYDDDRSEKNDKNEKDDFKEFAKELGGATTIAFFVTLAAAAANALIESMRNRGG